MKSAFFRITKTASLFLCGALLAVSCGDDDENNNGGGQGGGGGEEPETELFAKYAVNKYSEDGDLALVFSTAETRDGGSTFLTEGVWYEADVFSACAAATEPVDGTYLFDPANTGAIGTFCFMSPESGAFPVVADGTDFVKKPKTEIASGTLTVSHEGGALLVKAEFIRKDGSDEKFTAKDFVPVETGNFSAYSECDFSGNGDYTLYMSTAETGDGKTFRSTGFWYGLDLYGEPADDPIPTGPADGTYAFDADNTRKPGTFGIKYSSSGAFKINKVGSSFLKYEQKFSIQAGTLTVSHREGKLRVEADITLQGGTNEKFSARDFIMLGTQDKPTTLTADKVLDLSNVKTASLLCWGTDNGTGDWMIMLDPEKPDADGISISLYTESTDPKVIPTGTFTEGEDGTNVPGAAGKFRPGSYWPSLHQFYTTYYYTTDSSGKFFAGQATVKRGSIVIEQQPNEEYKYTFDLYDELGHRISGTWSGPVSL